MTGIASPYIVGIGGSIALVAGILWAWKLYLAKREKVTDLTSRSRAVELQKEDMICTGSPVTEDETLRAEFETVKKMPPQHDRDRVLEKLVLDAIGVGDWWLAMEIPKAMTSNLGKDKALKEVVDAAIAKKEWVLGALAADQMFYKNFQDQAKQRLTDAAGR